MHQPYFKTVMTATIITLLICNNTMAQVPAGKYNTTNYPEDRKAIEALTMADDSIAHVNDDYVAVGPEGRVSYGAKQWADGFKEKQATFKSVTLVPNTYLLRIYNGDAAVKNMTVDVVFNTPAGDMFITVVRTETYIKQDGRWHFVAGQGTKKASAEELKELGKKTK